MNPRLGAYQMRTLPLGYTQSGPSPNSAFSQTCLALLLSLLTPSHPVGSRKYYCSGGCWLLAKG